MTFAILTGNGIMVGVGGGRGLSWYLHSSSLFVVLASELDADASVLGLTCNASLRIGNDDGTRPR